MAATEQGTVTVVVEIPTGSRNKYELDPATGHIFLDRMLFTSMRYPADYGFIEGTLGGDGDPLDALVFVGEPTFPGCRIRARPIGLFRMRDEKGPDEKILCVPLRDPMWSDVQDLSDLNENLLNEIEHFFAVYKTLEDKQVDTEGFGDRIAALAVIDEARAAASTSSGEPSTCVDG
jgi:inorganic pyrophosphatase